MSETFLYQEEALGFLPGETVLDAIIRNERSIEFGCRNGSCQSCLLRSKTQPPVKAQDGLAQVLKEANCFLACKCPADAIESIASVTEDVLPKISTTVLLKDMISPDVMRLRLRLTEPFDYRPGMFVRLINGEGLKRSYSIANSSLALVDYIEFHIRLVPDGCMSNYLIHAKEPKFAVQGPFGNCTYQAVRQDQQLVFIGSGTGLAPLYAVITDALSHGHEGQMSLFFGGASFESLYFIDELKELAGRYPNVDVHFCTDYEDAEGRSERGSPLDVALAAIGSFTDCRVYTCGHPELVKAAKRKTFMAGANMSDIFSDSFDNQTG